MAKYIRRENGVYEVKIDEKLKKENVSNCFYTSDNDTNWNLLFEKEDLKQFKQANTIEELCDMFVVGINEKMPIEMPLREKEQYEKMKKVVSLGIKAKLNVWLKLAIWTDKGLIYVAKMNEKGELELL